MTDPESLYESLRLRYPPATQRCPRCHRVALVLEDEVGMHPCVWCGWQPGEPGEPGRDRSKDDDDSDDGEEDEWPDEDREYIDGDVGDDD